MSGYQGLLALHKNSRIPYKKSKNHSLSAEQKLFKSTLARKGKTYKITQCQQKNSTKTSQIA